jgi:hypothetical protein
MLSFLTIVRECRENVTYSDVTDLAIGTRIRANNIIIIISNLSEDRSKASSETIPPLNAIDSFLLQMRVSSSVSKHLAYMVSLFLERDYPGKVIMW